MMKTTTKILSQPNLPSHFVTQLTPTRRAIHPSHQQQQHDHPDLPFTHYTALHIFDFDGTLFNTPEPGPHANLHYQRVTGQELPVSQYWWTSHESLDTKVFTITPGPAYSDFYHSIANFNVPSAFARANNTPSTVKVEITEQKNSADDQSLEAMVDEEPSLATAQEIVSKDHYCATIMMTGRSKFLSKKVFNIMNSHKMRPLLSIFRPNNCRTSTMIYKMEALKQLVQEHFPHVTKIHMWDDRIEHVHQFRSIRLRNANKQTVEISVTHVTPNSALAFTSQASTAATTTTPIFISHGGGDSHRGGRRGRGGSSGSGRSRARESSSSSDRGDKSASSSSSTKRDRDKTNRNAKKAKHSKSQKAY